MSFIYCSQDRRGDRWYYQESSGFRESLPGSSSSLVRDKSKAYRFETKEEAWAHCRRRRRGFSSTQHKWIVITLATQSEGVADG